MTLSTNIEKDRMEYAKAPSVKAVYDFFLRKVQEIIKTMPSASAIADNITITGAGTSTEPFQISEEYQRRINAGI